MHLSLFGQHVSMNGHWLRWSEVGMILSGLVCRFHSAEKYNSLFISKRAFDLLNICSLSLVCHLLHERTAGWANLFRPATYDSWICRFRDDPSDGKQPCEVESGTATIHDSLYLKKVFVSEKQGLKTGKEKKKAPIAEHEPEL